jgi:gamma-glutamylcyclotransferase (GGCT)/AIG2-like uncharacterized protein YtfP
MKLFVYGTLRQGGANHHYLEHASLLEGHCWVFGEMHDTGLGYPVLKENKKRRVWGELYEVSTQQLSQIDQLEEYSPFSESNEYERVILQVYSEKRRVNAYVYLAGDQLLQCEEPIESGDWLRYVKKNKNRKC